jgi:hypothetical protein
MKDDEKYEEDGYCKKCGLIHIGKCKIRRNKNDITTKYN